MGNSFSYTTELKAPKKYGWKRDLPDQRDHVVKFNVSKTSLPEKVDLRDKCPPIYSQGSLGSCTSQAIAAAFLFDETLQQLADPFQPSRLYIYYNERMIEGSTDHDAGAAIRDGIKSINRWGVCHEKMWPYDITKFTNRPPDQCYVDAMNHRAISYHRLRQKRVQLKKALNRGYPVIFGISVYESLEDPEVARTGNVPMPQSTEKLLGGHAILLVGYDDSTQTWLFRNSWGTDWGDQGYGTLPYQYLDSKNMLASDFWILRKVETPKIDEIEDAEEDADADVDALDVAVDERAFETSSI